MLAAHTLAWLAAETLLSRLGHALPHMCGSGLHAYVRAAACRQQVVREQEEPAGHCVSEHGFGGMHLGTSCRS